MRALVIDDNEAKSRLIVEALSQSQRDPRRPSITVVRTLADAVRILNQFSFDMIALDLMLPYLSDGPPNSTAGLELLRQLRSVDGLNSTTTVIGISAFPDEVVAYRANFDKFGVLIIDFDDQGAWRQTLLRIVEDVSTRVGIQIDLDFLVICALEEERAGFARTAFRKDSEAVVSGLNVHYVRLVGQNELFGAIVRLGQMGLVAAAIETTSALNVFRTKLLCMSGICAGFTKQATLGQLVVASPAWEYQAGKWSRDGFEIAPVQIPLQSATRTVIDQTIARESFARYIEAGIETGQIRPTRQSKAIIAPFATGSAVIADPRRLKHIEQQHRKVAALDMETFGLYFAAHEGASLVQHFFSVKCVVDLADDDKGDDLHPYGCVVSARATEQIIIALTIPG